MRVFFQQCPKPVSEYKSLSALVSDLQGRLVHFLVTQALYFRVRKPPSAADKPPIMTTFTFEGEYSVVAPDLDVVKRGYDIIRNAVRIKGEMARLEAITFR